MQERLLRAADVADRLGIGVSTTWRNIHQLPGFPQPVKIAGATRFLESDVDNYIASLVETARPVCPEQTSNVHDLKVKSQGG